MGVSKCKHRQAFCDKMLALRSSIANLLILIIGSHIVLSLLCVHVEALKYHHTYASTPSDISTNSTSNTSILAPGTTTTITSSSKNTTTTTTSSSNMTSTSSNSTHTTITSNDTLCRCLPNSACWPGFDSWNTLNSSLAGRLLRPSPPASPCYEGPDQNATACQIAATNWTNPFWRADQVGAMQYANREAHGNQSCALLSSPYFTSDGAPSFASAGNASTSDRLFLYNGTTMRNASSLQKCQQGAIPDYAVEVLDPSHVQTAVAFATQHNIRLTVKSTGHDILGRSTAPGSLNLWMHRMKNITFHDSFNPDGCDANVTFRAVTVECGTQWEELYAAAHARNLVVVGSMAGSVSTGGGYLQGGGHSPLSPFLGLAADNVVEMKVVTADGRLHIANACQNQDLFWALRGGGGGTFGVVVSTTQITWPPLNNIVSVHFTATSGNATVFQELLANFVSLQLSLSESNFWAGYSYITSSPSFSLTFTYLVPNCNFSIAEASFEPLLNFTYEYPADIVANVSMNDFSSFKDWHSEVLCRANPGICSDPSGSNAALASRLLPQTVLQEQAPQLAQAFMEILSGGVGQIVGHLVGGRNVAYSQNLGSALDNNAAGGNITSSASTASSCAVNPAWRSALWHVVLVNSWGEQESYAQKDTKLLTLTQMNGLLRDLSPGSGCYLNEADVNEPNWQQALFGENYSRLKRIKESVDPQGFFTCTHCVGSEDWSITDQLICRSTPPATTYSPSSN